MSKEQLYTSTQTKLLHNLDRLREMQCGVFRPISIQLAPYNRCNLKCTMCSLANRNESEELSLKQCKKVLKDFKELGAQTVEFTGGGEFTIYPHANAVISEAYDLEYDIGLITNGVKLSNIRKENLEKLTWIRISLNCLDYVQDINVDIPENVTRGFSYVITELSNEVQLNKIAEYAEKYNAKYVRIVPNCLSVEDITKSTEMIKPYLDKYPRFFFQQKKYTVPNRCFIGYLKPFIAPDGYIYHCSASPLIERKFSEHFRLCHIDDIIKTWWDDAVPFNTSKCQEGKCFFNEHNQLIEQVIMPCEHSKFI